MMMGGRGQWGKQHSNRQNPIRQEDPLIIRSTNNDNNNNNKKKQKKKKRAIRTLILACLTYLSNHTAVCISLIKVKQMTYYFYQRNSLMIRRTIHLHNINSPIQLYLKDLLYLKRHKRVEWRTEEIIILTGSSCNTSGTLFHGPSCKDIVKLFTDDAAQCAVSLTPPCCSSQPWRVMAKLDWAKTRLLLLRSRTVGQHQPTVWTLDFLWQQTPATAFEQYILSGPQRDCCCYLSSA